MPHLGHDGHEGGTAWLQGAVDFRDGSNVVRDHEDGEVHDGEGEVVVREFQTLRVHDGCFHVGLPVVSPDLVVEDINHDGIVVRGGDEDVVGAVGVLLGVLHHLFYEDRGARGDGRGQFKAVS